MMVEEFFKIDFSKYPVLGPKEKNTYAKNLKKLVVIYNSMKNCFSNEDITSSFKQISNCIVETMETKLLTVNIKIDNDAAAKQ